MTRLSAFLFTALAFYPRMAFSEDLKKTVALQQAQIQTLKNDLANALKAIESLKASSESNTNTLNGLISGSVKLAKVNFANGSRIEPSDIGLLLYNQFNAYLALPSDDHFAYYGRASSGYPIWSCGGPRCGR